MVRAKLQDGTFTSSHKILFDTDPLFVTLYHKTKRTGTRKPLATTDADPTLLTFFFPCSLESETRTITYRPANGDDLPNICKFVDFWLSGGAKRLHIPGGGKDYFIPKGQQIGYLKYKTTYLATFDDKIIAWAVKSKNKTLIHLLVTPKYRGKGIGGHLLNILNPEFVRSKSDQSTGDPLKFYQKHGFEVVEAKTGKHSNIDIMKHHENPAKNPVTPTTLSTQAPT